MARIVTGYHGTLLRHAQALKKRQFDPSKGKRVERWLGSGLYFFEDNFEAARHYAVKRAISAEEDGAVLQARIDLTACLDLTKLLFQQWVRDCHAGLKARGKIGDGVGPQQKALEILHDEVRAGFSGEWDHYGWNALDYFVIEETIKYVRDKEGLTLDTVRAVFLEGKALFDDSWLYNAAHVSVVVRDIEKRLVGEMNVITVD